jgi:hypothetical protein
VKDGNFNRPVFALFLFSINSLIAQKNRTSIDELKSQVVHEFIEKAPIKHSLEEITDSTLATFDISLELYSTGIPS